jgi:hypothetical protein
MLSKEKKILNGKLKVWTNRPKSRHDCHIDGIIVSSSWSPWQARNRSKSAKKHATAMTMIDQVLE